MLTATGKVSAEKRTTSLNPLNYTLEIHAAREISSQHAHMECRSVDLKANASLWAMTVIALRALIASPINIAIWGNAQTSRR